MSDNKKVVQESVKKIRIILVSRNVKAIEEVSNSFKKLATDEHLQIKGPVRMPTKILRITTRQSPCGEGTNTYDHFELRIHKRIIDIIGDPQLLKSISNIKLLPEVNVEIKMN